MRVRHVAGVVAAAAGIAFAASARADAPPVPDPGSGCAVSNDGRVALWRGEGTAQDSVGGHDGTLVGAATAGYRPGVVGQALSLPGEGDHVEIPNAPEFDLTGELTLEAWVQIDDTSFAVGGDRVIFWNSNAAETPVFALWIEGDGTSALAAPLRFFATPATDDPAFVDSQALAWQSGRWYHVAVTRSAGVVSFYRDGAPVGSATLAAPRAADGDLPLGLGAAPIAGSAYNPVKGAIDEAAIWHRALAASEVGALNAAGTGGCNPPPPPPTGGSGLPPTAGPTIRPAPRLPVTVDPTRVTIAVTPSRDRLRPYAFTASGKLVLPAGVSAANACKGSVVVRIKRRTTTLKIHTVPLKPDCTYRSRTTDTRSGTLAFTARFMGNPALFAKTSVSRVVRAG
jgi:hypothetical protein